MNLPAIVLEDFVRKALAEDLGHGRDITSELLVPGSAEARAVLRARGPGMLAGLVPALTAFSLSDSDMAFDVQAVDGDLVAPGMEIATIEGPARAILTAERTALNILSHLSGVASMTAVYAREVEGTNARIAATRKTLPGLRLLQKYAVEVGGGLPHRYGLDDGVLIKDNHIALAGGIEPALSLAAENAGHTLKIEIEVDSIAQLEQVLSFNAANRRGADIVLLDNMDLKTLKKAVKIVNGSMVTEASGGVNLDTVKDIARTGVDVISVGALTHSVQALDIGLDFE